ncbi:MAG: HTTM domain-containing protein [Planctomycetaceae bacterium]|nr:HTTM domain-containing protein [Planctomycetaceae bacterium]
MSQPQLETPILQTQKSYWDQLNDFFFAEETPYALALVRILFPLALLVGVIPRWFHVRELYSLDGAPTPFWEGYGYQDLPIIFSPWIAMAAYTVMVCCLCTMSLGWQTRFSTIVVLVLYPYFGLTDYLSTLTKYTVVATHILLLLSMSGCGRVWSIDAWLAGDAQPQKAAAWPRRLMQILIAVVYLGAAVTKLRMPEYLSGDLMRFWMLTNTNFANPLGEWFSTNQVSIVAMCYITLIWEIVFPFLCWRGLTRTVVLGLGVFFHILTFFMLGLLVFPLVYIAVYCAFLNEEEASWLGSKLKSWGGQIFKLFPAGSPRESLFGRFHHALFASALTVITLLAVTAEAQMDLYGEQRAEGRHVLTPISPEREAELFSGDLKIRPIDKVFAFDTGTTLLGGQLANSRSEFRRGETLVAQCMLTPPHEDIWLEIDLHNSDNLQVDRFAIIAPREEVRVYATFPLREFLEPGQYAVVLKLQGREVTRRHVELLP